LASGFNVGYCYWSGPLKPRVGVWPGRKPFSREENSPIAFICELTEQVRIGPILAGEGQFAISDRANAAHVKNPKQTGIQKYRGRGLVPVRRLARATGARFTSDKWRLKGAGLAMVVPRLSFRPMSQKRHIY